MTVPGQDPASPGTQDVPNPSAQPAAQPPATELFDGEPFNAQRAKDLIEKQRTRERELAAKVKELEPLANKAKELEDAQRTDLEKAQAKAADLEAKLAQAQQAHAEALIRAAVEREAHAQGAVKAEVVYRLVDRSGIALDESGEVKGADKAVKALLEAEPYLKGQTGNGTSAVPGTPRPNGHTQTREQLINDKYERLKAARVGGRS
jgi:DNA repair exonuclease SbcCD ATPase subunit